MCATRERTARGVGKGGNRDGRTVRPANATPAEPVEKKVYRAKAAADTARMTPSIKNPMAVAR
jgi:hypothetical protein